MDVGAWSSVLELSRRFSKESEPFQLITGKKEPVLTAESDARNLLSRGYKHQNILNKSLISFIGRVKEAKLIRKKSSNGDFIV
ncbi:hypothetical protein QUS22_00030 [Wolbachia pipientis]|uniref:hypothetical protein n=1 Tax=Wolbachia pipientis TaxID=955 RepID=UPI0025A3E569|nr:hypothetical protein [Wolbachia pipientis]MDM8334794.1 hypothetical protein [Wolbachia pipientis]